MLVLPVDGLLLLSPVLVFPDQPKAWAVFAAVGVFLICARGRYRARLYLSVLDDLPGLLGNLFIAAAIVATATAFRHEKDDVTTFLLGALVAIGMVVVGRTLTSRIITVSRRRRITLHRTILIGGGKTCDDLFTILGAHPEYGLQAVGFVDDRDDSSTSLAPHLGGLQDLDTLVRETGADVLIVANGALPEKLLRDAVRTPSCMSCDLLVVPRLPDFNTQIGQSCDHIGSIPIMRIRTPNLSGSAYAIKRAFDIVAAAVMLVLLAPVIALFAVLLRWEGGPHVIFRQTRVGRDGQLFELLKLRSMRPLDATESATTWSIANDRRLGPVGRFVRRTSIDELPQLWNILRGEMTMVGPRPERPHFVEQFSREYDRYSHRHRVRAGLTGLAQVSGLRGNTSIDARARFDNFYIENWSLWLDVKILLRTFAQVLFARGR